jgi:outer membrane protein assembly factor BamB
MMRISIVSMAVGAAALLAPAEGPVQGGGARGATVANVIGTWTGEASHAGETSPVAMELEPAEKDTVIVKLSIPAINWTSQSVPTMKLSVTGNDVTIGPFSFVYRPESDTLTGTLPAALVPVHKVPIVLRRAQKIEFAPRVMIDTPSASPVWTFDASAPMWGGTAFSGGIVYAGGDDGRLYAVDARSGQPRWTFHAGGAIKTRPAIDEGDLFIADDGMLYKLSAATGAELWRVRLEPPVTRSKPGDPKSRFDRYGSDAAVAGDRVYVGTHEGRILALDRARGSRLWTFAATDAVLAAPAVDGGRVFFGSYDGAVYAIDAAAGSLLWKHETGAAVVSTPALHEGTIVVGSRSYDLLGLTADRGAVAWTRYFWFSWVESSATIRDGVAYVGSSDAARVFAVDARNGRRVWATDVNGRAFDQPAVTSARVYIGAIGNANPPVQYGAVVALDRVSGTPVWRFAAAPTASGPYGFASSPALGNGLVFIAGLDGRIYAFEQ